MKSFLTLSSVLALLPAVVKAGLEDAKYSTVLTPKNFDNVIASQSEGTLVAFFAPWCGHCKSLEPVWSRIAEAFDGDDRCKVAHLNADEATARPISSKYGVSGFPTLKFLSPPSKGSKVDTYNGPRTEEAFLEYLNEKCGTQKGKGGILNELAGRIPSLDQLAKFYLFPTTLRKPLLSQAEQLISKGFEDRKGLKDYYLRLFKKWSELAEDNVGEAKEWIEKELARLKKLAQKKGQIQVEKLEEVKMKQNILAVFASAQASASSISASASSVGSSVSSQASSVATDVTSTVESVAAKVTDRVKQEL
ncbi:endoplasmic reticulum resident protein 29 [Sporobolomyces salmoneus]|uniref:endoplasmic reticulum resident protein 29 n=1 Tax=Sporobolomyces salmoneus TaxID=183962 RepID=UPI003173A3BD